MQLQMNREFLILEVDLFIWITLLGEELLGLIIETKDEINELIKDYYETEIDCSDAAVKFCEL